MCYFVFFFRILKGKINNIFVADDDGEMDEDFPPINDSKDITTLGLNNFFIQRIFDDSFDAIPENRNRNRTSNPMPIPMSVKDSPIIRGYRTQAYSAEESKNDELEEHLLTNVRKSTSESLSNQDYGTFHQNNNILCCFCCSKKRKILVDDEYDESTIDASDSDDEQLGRVIGFSHSKSKGKIFQYEQRTGNSIGSEGYLPPNKSNAQYFNEDDDSQQI